MLNFNFLNNFKHWGEALHVIENKMLTNLQTSGSQWKKIIWRQVSVCEELKKYLEEYYTKTGSMRVLILNSWLGVPIVPLLCENMDVAQIHMVDLDEESIELSKVLHKHYAQEKFVNIRHWNFRHSL